MQQARDLGRQLQTNEHLLPQNHKCRFDEIEYDTIFELETAMCTSAFDKFTLGCKLTSGDPFDLPNPLARAAVRGSFDPRDEETNRLIAGNAAVQALSHPAAVEFTVSAEKGNAPPDAAEWARMFGEL